MLSDESEDSERDVLTGGTREITKPLTEVLGKQKARKSHTKHTLSINICYLQDYKCCDRRPMDLWQQESQYWDLFAIHKAVHVS